VSRSVTEVERSGVRLSRLRDAVAGAVTAPADAAGAGTWTTTGTATGAATPTDPEVTAVVHDTAAVVPGALFCCVPGSRVDGHDLAPRAVAAGAVALLVERPVAGLPQPVPQVVVPSVRQAMGPVAAAFWGHPSRSLQVLGVTGTAGKTTVTHLLRAVLEAAGLPCGVIGTLSGARTTPEAPELQALLAGERAAGRAAVAMEVSSHGLELHRVDATRFAVAVFTNLSREHLDFHRSMDAYFSAKARLFRPAFTDRAVVCVDDDWGRRLHDQLAVRGDVALWPYGLGDVDDLQLGAHGARFTWRDQDVTLALPGRFNVRNAVAAATAARALGVEPELIAAGLRSAEPVPGRFEPVDAGQPFTVLVDYAHKPDALEQALQAGRELAAAAGEAGSTRETGGGGRAGRLLVVFGCGGDRDATKRPVMGEVAARLADQVVLTSDNPRSEDPMAIIDDVRAGIPEGAPLVVEPDRRRAIERAVADARPGDVVLIAGKGHEQTQTIGRRVLPFDDRQVAREALAGQADRRPTARTAGPAGTGGRRR
jgi:UDP-N-acetylmuramoyl-L-alanyl-D-glutamate--2,6-diaminopimelate ligase